MDVLDCIRKVEMESNAASLGQDSKEYYFVPGSNICSVKEENIVDVQSEHEKDSKGCDFVPGTNICSVREENIADVQSEHEEDNEGYGFVPDLTFCSVKEENIVDVQCEHEKDSKGCDFIPGSNICSVKEENIVDVQSEHKEKDSKGCDFVPGSNICSVKEENIVDVQSEHKEKVIVESVVERKNGCRKTCSMAGCDVNQARFPGLHFFKFPVPRPAVCEQWIVNCANEALDSLPQTALRAKVVCEKHFTKDSFTSTLKTRLKLNAIPIRLPYPSSPITPVSKTAHSVEKSSTSPIAKTPTKTKRSLFKSAIQDISSPLYKKYKSLRGRKPTPYKNGSPGRQKLLKRLENALQSKKKFQQALTRTEKKSPSIPTDMLLRIIQSRLPEKVALFVSMQLKHSEKKKVPWTEEEMKQAIAMKYTSPVLYDQMRSDGFSLPSPTTIARWLQVVDLRPGMSNEIFQLLKSKVEHMPSSEKNTVIMFDEMCIKSSLEYNSKKDLVEEQ